MSSFCEANYIRLNLSGKTFALRKSGIQKFAEHRTESTLLDKFVKYSHQQRLGIADDYIPSKDSYYFFRSAELFEFILDFHQTNELHVPKNVCKGRFFRELEFWQIRKTELCTCCSEINEQTGENYFENREETQPLITEAPEPDKNSPGSRKLSSPVLDEAIDLQQFKNAAFGEFREKLWLFFEDPSSSFPAKVFAFLSGTVVLLSILALVCGTLPEFQVENPPINATSIISTANGSTAGKNSGELVKNRVENRSTHPVFEYVELFCVVWFTAEYLIRLITCVNRWEYARGTMNIIDLASIAPFYVELIFYISGSGSESKLQDIKSLLLTLRILRILRVARIFRLARYSGSMQAFGQTMKASKREFGMLMVYMSISVLLFSTAVYFMEKDEPNSAFRSIPGTFWWCVVTMTTVGYGDMIPKTVGGKIFASMTSVSGVIVLAFPVTMIVTNFNVLYQACSRMKPGADIQRKLTRKESVKVHSVLII